MSPNTQTAYTALTNFNNTAPTAQTIQKQSADKYDVSGMTSRLSGLQTGVNNLQSSLNNVDPSVTGRLQGNFATTGQRSALIAKEQAPIAQNLNTENSLLNEGQTNLTTARSQANDEANATLSDQARTYQHLLDSYNAANAEDHFKQQMDLENRKLATSQNSGIDIGSILGALSSGNGAPAAPSVQAGMVQRGGGGFNFTDQHGKPISAGEYAHLTGKSFRDVLSTMASHGDQGAKAALGFVGDDFGYDKAKIGGNYNLYKVLTGSLATPGPSGSGPDIASFLAHPTGAQPINTGQFFGNIGSSIMNGWNNGLGKIFQPIPAGTAAKLKAQAHK